MYTAYVTYEVDGTVYNNVKVKGTNDMEPGCQIEVLYQPNEPQKAKSWADLERNYRIDSEWAVTFQSQPINNILDDIHSYKTYYLTENLTMVNDNWLHIVILRL